MANPTTNAHLLHDQIAHAAASSDWVTLQQLLSENWSVLLLSDPALLRQALGELPDEVLAENPRWDAARNYVNYLPVDEAARNDRYRYLSTAPTPTKLVDVLVDLTSRAAAHRSEGEYEAAAKEVAEAHVELDAANPDSFKDLHYAIPDLHAQWGRVHELAGEFPLALAEYQDAYDLAVVTGNDLIRDTAAGNIAWIHMIGGHKAIAQRWLDRVPPLDTANWATRRYGAPAELARIFDRIDNLDREGAGRLLDVIIDVSAAPECWAAILYLRARLCVSPEQAWNVLSEIDTAVTIRPPKLVSRGLNAQFLAVGRAELFLVLAMPARAREVIDQVDLRFQPSTFFLDVTRAKIDLMAGNLAEVSRRADALLPAAAVVPRVLVEALLLRAVAYLRSDRVADARLAGEQALVVARDRHIPYAFTTIPRDAFDDLAELIGLSDEDPLVTLVREQGVFPVAAAPSGLSRRERLVLAELAKGATVPEISARLYVSQNTVKSQLRAAYRKVGAANRTEAIDIVTRHGLL
ncbi:helix-turn-helix transcriptional regulator [Herbiconiux ginsengi]|uniref:Regulatory protein, luxR family n=1 Tax=Herbiconiux ginsengi TaxID=381665 RepID=A0A1H3L6H1_9MICO|nr:LuxR C-terminal-related transcriptional regulator [Herbiconiux ginsengi]SDY59930.1 regulatory protein, luxR family [Herbiconiux ginsengi]